MLSKLYLQMGVPLVQDVLEVCCHVPHSGLHLLWMNATGPQPLEIQHVLLTVGQLLVMKKTVSQCDEKGRTQDKTGRR